MEYRLFTIVRYNYGYYNNNGTVLARFKVLCCMLHKKVSGIMGGLGS